MAAFVPSLNESNTTCHFPTVNMYLDKQQYVQYFSLSLAVFLPQYQHVQQAASHSLSHLRKASLQLGHGVHPALAVLHHLREQEGECANTHFGFRPAQRPLQNSRLASGEASLHDHSNNSCEGKKRRCVRDETLA